MHFNRVDRTLLFFVCLPLVAYCAWTKWAVVQALYSLHDLALLDFFRLHTGYYGLILLWGSLMFGASNGAWRARVLALVMLLYFTIADLGYSASIHTTGVLAPYDIALYSGKSVGLIPLSIRAAEYLTIVILPGTFLLAAVIVWRQWRKRVPDSAAPYQILAITAILLGCQLLPPFTHSTDLNLARPAYAYQLMEYVAKNWGITSAHASAAPALTDRTLPIMPAPVQPQNVSQSQSHAPNLVVIALESVSADAVSLYNPERAGITPFLQSLASSSWVAKQAYTVVPHTSKAIAAINCGQQPYMRHPIYESLFGTPSPCLAEYLRERGYATVFFQSAMAAFENGNGQAEKLGFAEFYPGEKLDPAGFELANYFGYEDNVLLKPTADWLKHQTAPFYAFYMTGTTHHPYWAPDTYGYQSYVTGNKDQNNYLNAVHYLDHFLQNLFEVYKQAGLYDNTIFVIVGDHGESFGRHPRMQHNTSLYQEVMQVPLLVHAPALIQTAQQGGLASQVDIMPTALDLMGFGVTETADGISLIGSTQRKAQRKLAFGYCWYDDWCASAVDEQYKFIANFDQKGDELFDLQQDPHEQHNIIAQFPAVAEQMSKQVVTNRARQFTRWDAYLGGLDHAFWLRSEKTLGNDVSLLRLSGDDRRRKHLLE